MPASSQPSILSKLVSKSRTLWSASWPAGGWLKRAIRVLSGQGAREGYLAAVDQGVISVANFAATIILARAISPTELGVYGVGFTTLRLVRSVQEGLTIQPVNTFGAGMELSEFQRYATSTSLIQLMLALLSSSGIGVRCPCACPGIY